MYTPEERRHSEDRRRVVKAACQMWGKDLIDEYGEPVEVYSSPRYNFLDRLSPPHRIRFQWMFGPFIWAETDRGPFFGRPYALWVDADGELYQAAGDEPKRVGATMGYGVPAETYDEIIRQLRRRARRESLPLEIK